VHSPTPRIFPSLCRVEISFNKKSLLICPHIFALANFKVLSEGGLLEKREERQLVHHLLAFYDFRTFRHIIKIDFMKIKGYYASVGTPTFYTRQGDVALGRLVIYLGYCLCAIRHPNNQYYGLIIRIIKGYSHNLRAKSSPRDFGLQE